MEIEIARQIGQAVRKQRKALGLTQNELAEKAHVDRSLIIRIESGEAKSLYPEKLLNVLHALDLKMAIEPKESKETTKRAGSKTTYSIKKHAAGKIIEKSASPTKERAKAQQSAAQHIRGLSEGLLLSAHTEVKPK